MRRARGILFFVYCLLALSSQAQAPRVQIIAEGLYYPAGLAALPDGGILIAEAGGHGEHSAGISLLQSDGVLGRLLSLAPSGRINNGLFSAPVAAVSPDGADIIVAFPSAELFSLPVAQAAQLPDEPFTPPDLLPRQSKRANVFLLQPFAIAFDAAGAPLISDAAGNGLLREGTDRSLRYVHQFSRLDNPRLSSGRLDALPTGITRHANATIVALLGGCPHVQNSGELVELTDAGGRRSLVDGLNMPIDVALDGNGALWILEFGTVPPSQPCFTDLQELPASGVLSRLDKNGILRTILTDLHFPSALLPMPDGSLYISEFYRGRLLHIRFDGPPPQPRHYLPADPPPATYAPISDLDEALRRVITQQGLSAYPGRELIEADSELTRLGRDLFFDPILSGDRNIACATCHHPAFAMADARALPIGAGGTGLGESRSFRAVLQLEEKGAVVNPFVDVFIPRNSPTIINSALLSQQFWDGRVGTSGGVRTPEAAIDDLGLSDPLTAQALFPITSQHEMAGITFGTHPPMVIRQALLQRLRDNPEYGARFAEVFGSDEINLRQLAEAVAAFERQLIFTAAPWDEYVAGDDTALSPAQKRGALLFFGEMKAGLGCAGCHSGDLFTDQRFHNLLAPQVGPGKDNGVDGTDDLGRANVSFDYRDQYRFKTPSLRNVALTSPYLHSGAYRDLASVTWHHADPWRANITYSPSQQLPPELQDQLLPYDFDRQAHSVAQPLRAGLPMNEADVADLVRFLKALTDPAAQDLSHIIPETVPSGLPVDALP
ncbi:MAG: hypothetical protein OXI62_06115 [Chloroflexota bacterium]|nr:hypothetical protein [Chloroflexota bacterium]MXX84218.1 hypothetical protein [Chloroflexota bacterium]MYA93672.1 hypothetical protein [Chloroflexota bacterium]MYD38791.1 hypothetical protein [Chloroflexota bacterium]MYH66244.1 hypothetical protein [Chloroflexota bacterium]